MTPVTRRSLYLVRHAIAEEHGSEWPDDSRRPLTHKGTARMRQSVNGLLRLGVGVDVVLTSPLVRATETAAVLVEGLEPAPSLAVTASLAPGQPRDAVVRALSDYEALSVALVGHEPDMGELAAWLVGARAPIVFKKGGVCRIDAGRLPSQGTGRLIWHATPAMLRAVGRG